MSTTTQTETPSSPTIKRNEITYGYLASAMPDDLSGPAGLKATLIGPSATRERIMDLDVYFMGARRRLIDEMAHVRQLINYIIVTKRDVNGKLLVATYVRGAGAEARLSGNLSIGFGGHIETEDLIGHDGKISSSYGAIIDSGMRELHEEVQWSEYCNETHKEIGLSITTSDPMGFITDVKPDVKDWVGNTHLGVISLVHFDYDGEAVLSFELKEERYEAMGWYSLEGLLSEKDRLEPWTAAVVEIFDDLVAYEALAYAEAEHVPVTLMQNDSNPIA